MILLCRRLIRMLFMGLVCLFVICRKIWVMRFWLMKVFFCVFYCSVLGFIRLFVRKIEVLGNGFVVSVFLMLGLIFCVLIVVFLVLWLVNLMCMLCFFLIRLLSMKCVLLGLLVEFVGSFMVVGSCS